MHKYKVKEYLPKGDMRGTHSFYVEAAPFQTLNNAEMAKKVEARTGFRCGVVGHPLACVGTGGHQLLQERCYGYPQGWHQARR